jgi:hypothetical protein
MRRISPVLALSTVLASFILIATQQHPADAACGSDRLPGCDGPLRPGPGDFRGRDHDFPPELWDRVKNMQLSPAGLDDLIKRMEEIAHKIADAEGRAVDYGKKLGDIDDQIDKLRTDRITAEAEKHAAEEERDRQQLRLVGLLHDIRPPPGPQGGCGERRCPPDDCRERRCPPDDCRERRCPEDWRARRWFRPRPVFRHFCPPPEFAPAFPPLFGQPVIEREFPPPREREFYPPPPREREFYPPPPREREFYAPPPREREFYPPPRREYQFREIRPTCCGCEHPL